MGEKGGRNAFMFAGLLLRYGLVTCHLLSVPDLTQRCSRSIDSTQNLNSLFQNINFHMFQKSVVITIAI